jgi:hypothetical protein
MKHSLLMKIMVTTQGVVDLKLLVRRLFYFASRRRRIKKLRTQKHASNFSKMKIRDFLCMSFKGRAIIRQTEGGIQWHLAKSAAHTNYAKQGIHISTV